MDITQAVQNLYERFPFPPDPVSGGLPPGWNWRWSWSFAHSFCTGLRPAPRPIRILDAGCGTGVSTEYLAFQNPQASVTAVDLSEASLAIARMRPASANVHFEQMSITEIARLEGPFDFINCVGVLHHMSDPVAGIRALADQLAPGGLLHVFVYADLGRFEIQLMQEAIRILRSGEDPLADGLKVGRGLFEALSPDNRLVKAEAERWALENRDDACFVDMYVHVQEIRYTIPKLFALVDASGLQFQGFSNPQFWQLERLLHKAPWLLERSAYLSERERYRLVELLDPVVSWYELFLCKPPLERVEWTDTRLQAAYAHRSPFINPWPAAQVFDHEYEVVNLSESEIAFLTAADGSRTVEDLLGDLNLDQVRQLQGHFLVQFSSEPTEHG